MVVYDTTLVSLNRFPTVVCAFCGMWAHQWMVCLWCAKFAQSVCHGGQACRDTNVSVMRPDDHPGCGNSSTNCLSSLRQFLPPGLVGASADHVERRSFRAASSSAKLGTICASSVVRPSSSFGLEKGCFWSRNVVKRGVCYGKVCPSICHTRVSCLNASNYRIKRGLLYTMKGCFSCLRAWDQILQYYCIWEFTPNKAKSNKIAKQSLPPWDSESWTHDTPSLKRCKIAR